MPLTLSLTELTTAATDAALGATCAVLLWRLRTESSMTIWKRNVWSGVFSLLLFASALGALAHGVDLSPRWSSEWGLSW